MAGAGSMIDCCDLIAGLAARGWNQGSGVPCSTFAGPIAHLSASGHYRAAANEGLALSGAVGARLAGRREAVFLQNSGLGNLINPLTSLCHPYAVPVLALVSMRGWPDPAADEPQHALMGQTTETILSALGIWHTILTAESLDAALDRAEQVISGGRSAFLLLPHRSISQHPGATPALPTGGPDTADVTSAVTDACPPGTAIFATTGFTSRYLHDAQDRPENFYMQGSMGHVSSLALGYANAAPEKTVIVLDGDGAALMHLGAVSTIGAAQPANLVHVVIDNGGYESTGSQQSTSGTTDLAAVAKACGYRAASTVDTAAALQQQLASAAAAPGPHFILVRAGRTIRQTPQRAGASLSLPHIAARLQDATLPAAAAPSHA
ncbi:phosphonopyruvate decarboxylase [Arthrobacter sp. NyZ413]|uniref:phosphonopyruvate decarboxylase n=1 Tax=Arthrobacter sp. NyZ413 TaxID=3144669 RepID=UPI003BF87AD5